MSQTVLLVEDDATVRKLVTACLEREDFIVLAAIDGTEALGIFRSRLKIDLLLTDVHMEGGISGIEVATRVIDEKLGTRVLVMSGYPASEVQATEKCLPFLPKPFTPATLIEAVRKVLGSSAFARSEHTLKVSAGDL